MQGTELRSVVHVATESARHAPCPRCEFSEYGTRPRHTVLWHVVARSRLDQGLDASRALWNKIGWKTLHSNIFQRPRSLGDETLTRIPDLSLRRQLWQAQERPHDEDKDAVGAQHQHNEKIG